MTDVCLLVITDGRRGCIAQTIPSALESLQGSITRKLIYDDSGDDGYHDWLTDTFPGFEVFSHPVGRQGFGGAIRAAWAHLHDVLEPLVFHLEDDFTFNRAVSLDDMAAVLQANPNLVQLALRRQPWNDIERDAGGVVESRADEYDERTDGVHDWLEHRLFFTTNPCLYRSEMMWKHPWPKGNNSEGRFSIDLCRSPKVRFGFWGARGSGEWVTHIGADRVGVGY